jgi:hypothetical protein
MKRMAILLPDLRPGGAQTVMVRVANGLVARGHSISLIVLDGVGALHKPYRARRRWRAWS